MGRSRPSDRPKPPKKHCTWITPEEVEKMDRLTAEFLKKNKVTKAAPGAGSNLKYVRGSNENRKENKRIHDAKQ